MNPYNILVVDDEVGNLSALERALRREYSVFLAVNSEEAMAMAEQNDIALIVADHRMPGMTGVEFLERIAQKFPDTIRIILTAYTDEKLLMDAINMGHVYSYVTKPWGSEEIRALVKEGLEAYEINRASKELYARTLLRSGIISREQLSDALRVQRVEKKTLGEILVEHGMISRSQLDVAVKLQEAEGKQLGEVLIERGVISSSDLEMARDLQKQERKSLAEILVELGYTDEETIFSCYSLQLGMPYISLAQFSVRQEIIKMLPSRLAHKYAMIPVDVVGRVLVAAVSEPLNDVAKNETEKETGYKVMVVCASYRDIKSALEQWYPNMVSVKNRQRY